MLWGLVTERQDQHPGLGAVKAEVSAAVFVVSVSTAEAKREQNKSIKQYILLKRKKKTTQQVFFLLIRKKYPQECSII